MTERPLSHAIAEGDGISLVALVSDAETARAAEADGAEAVAVVGDIAAVREATTLPILCFWVNTGPDGIGHADACAVRAADVDQVEGARNLELALWVDDEEELAEVLDRFDPELLLLNGTFESVLDLLTDVPVGKLVIAELRETRGDEFDELERAGVDAVIVRDREHL
ncbi:MAG TPA: hypothetical protein VIR14_09690 [Gaiellaceae bacterium]